MLKGGAARESLGAGAQVGAQIFSKRQPPSSFFSHMGRGMPPSLHLMKTFTLVSFAGSPSVRVTWSSSSRPLRQWGTTSHLGSISTRAIWCGKVLILLDSSITSPTGSSIRI